MRYPVGNVQYTTGNVGLKLRGKTGSGYVVLAVIYIWMIVKPMGINEVTKRKSTGGKGKRS